MTRSGAGELDLAGHAALVTGSGRNIGRAIVVELAAHGANVIVNARSDERAVAEVVAQAESHGVSALGFVGDITRPSAFDKLYERAVDSFGTVDIVVSNANPRLHKSLDDTSIDDWNRHLNAQLTTSFLLAKRYAPGMRRAGWGRIIHINGPDGWYGGPRRLPASSGKAGLRNLTKSLAVELGDSGVTVNDVVPGVVDTLRDPSTHPQVNDAYLAKITAEVPIHRLVEPSEIAWACLWLCSERSGAVNGTAVHVDGGWKMLG